MSRDFEVVGIPKAGAGFAFTWARGHAAATAQPGDVSFFFVKVQDDGRRPGGGGAREALRGLQGHGLSSSEAMKENALGLKEFIRALSFFAALISCLGDSPRDVHHDHRAHAEIGILKAPAPAAYILKVVMAESFLISRHGRRLGISSPSSDVRLSPLLSHSPST
jgi:hypothetical protein